MPFFVVTRSMGNSNSPTTNKRSYIQTTNELTRNAYQGALIRLKPAQ